MPLAYHRYEFWASVDTAIGGIGVGAFKTEWIIQSSKSYICCATLLYALLADLQQTGRSHISAHEAQSTCQQIRSLYGKLSCDEYICM